MKCDKKCERLEDEIKELKLRNQELLNENLKLNQQINGID
jgi:predicted RNase H-like nuclease (RuvC/YqgF family)